MFVIDSAILCYDFLLFVIEKVFSTKEFSFDDSKSWSNFSVEFLHLGCRPIAIYWLAAFAILWLCDIYSLNFDERECERMKEEKQLELFRDDLDENQIIHVLVDPHGRDNCDLYDNPDSVCDSLQPCIEHELDEDIVVITNECRVWRIGLRPTVVEIVDMDYFREYVSDILEYLDPALVERLTKIRPELFVAPISG